MPGTPSALSVPSTRLVKNDSLIVGSQPCFDTTIRNKERRSKEGEKTNWNLYYFSLLYNPSL